MKLDKAQALLDEQPISIDVLLEKYAKGDEKTVDEVRRRVARGLAHVEKPELREIWEKRFHDAMVDGFIPGGRVNSAAGTGIAATLINCFVQPVGDAISGTRNGVPSIYLALNQAAESATTSRRSDRRAPWSTAPTPAPAARFPTCACSTRAARRWSRPAPGAARRWA
jgi:hypothetical protein